MKTVQLLTSILFWLFLRSLVLAQPYVAWVKHYGPENGLSHREINAIFQDRQGFMWFGTKFGLNRFDGRTFTAVTKERNGLDFDDIQSIAQDADENLWLKERGKSQITLFNPLTSKAVSFADKFSGQLPSALCNDLQGLLSTDNGTIFLTNYQPAALITYHPKSGLRSVALPQFKTLGTFRATSRNTVWAIADGNSVVELTADGRVLHQFSHGQDVVNWCFGQRNAGIAFFYWVYNPANIRHHTFYRVDESGHRREWPSALLESMKRYMGPVCYPVDQTGLLWDGISLRDSTNRTVLTIAGQTAGETIENRSFYRSQNGLLWLGTSFGVYQVKLAQNHFQRLAYQDKNGEQGTAIRGITVLGDQVFANLEKSGLYQIPRRGGVPKKLYANSVFAYGIAHDAPGQIYAGNGQQVVAYNPSTGTHATLTEPNASAIWTFHQLSPNQWLAGSQQGLLWLNTKTRQATPFTQYNHCTELAQAHVLHIAADRTGTVWICSETGLYRFDPQNGITARYWRGGKNEFHLPADSYQHFYQDANGIYWLATANAGLIRWNRQQNQFRQFRRTDGLSNDNIYAVYPDQRGNLWMSSDYGIMRFDPVRQITQAYFVQDGITHNEFNRVAHFQDKSGRIYFGGLNGITAFDPRDFVLEKPPVPLSMRIVSFRQFDQDRRQLVDKTGDVTRTNTITIRPDDQSAVLDFALLNYTDAEKNVYAYQVKGLDNEWTHQTESTLRLSNLPYGTHQLLIKGQAPNGQWSVNTLMIGVEVLRPFYLRSWFFILAFLVLVAGIWSWMQWRIWSHQRVELRLQTEIRQATAQIEQDKELIEQQAQLLHRLNETKSRFFANISHEFRTPLTVILGMAAELKRYEPAELTRQIHRSSELIERNGRNLLRLINQILDLSKLEAGEMYLQPIRADLIGFTRYVAESFHTMAAVRDIDLHFQANAETVDADFDKDKIQDILSNLLTNAIKFTPAGGHVFCQLTMHDTWPALTADYYEAVLPTQPRNDSWISIRVRNTGPGIEADDLPRIFDRFYQRSADAIATRPVLETGGTGIGLSLVRELVVLMNGGLAVRSQPGEGTEFIIWLRHTRQAPAALIPAASPVSLYLPPSDEGTAETGADGEKPVLLLVEDNEDVASYITACVQENYQILRAGNGQEGIDLAVEKVPDLVLSDVMMPEKDGFQLCDELKNDLRTSHIPLVLLTARAASSDRIAGLRRGADAYLTKPFHREELRLVLTNLLQTRRRLQRHYSQLALQPASVNPAPTDIDDSLEDQFLLSLRSLLEGELDNTDFSIDDICQRMGMSRTTLHLKLVALTGLSTTRYVRSLRLGKAKDLLLSTGLNVSEVAYRVGFDDPKYFSRVFSDEFGVSPANFRRSAQSEQ